METRVEPRFRKRLPCRLKVAGHSHAGMVLNISRGGLFIQTSAGPRPGVDVAVDLDVSNHPGTFAIGGRVVWRRVVASHLRTLSQGGIGVRIESAPEAYYDFLSGVTGEAPSAAPSAARGGTGAEAKSRSDSTATGFRVRLKQQGGPRSRTVRLYCGSEEEARERALAVVGAGWAVLELEGFS